MQKIFLARTLTTKVADMDRQWRKKALDQGLIAKDDVEVINNPDEGTYTVPAATYDAALADATARVAAGHNHAVEIWERVAVVVGNVPVTVEGGPS